MLEGQIRAGNDDCLLYFFFSGNHSFLTLLLEIEDRYLICHIVEVVCLIQEYENYLTYVYMSLHYCESFQLTLILLRRVETG